MRDRSSTLMPASAPGGAALATEEGAAEAASAGAVGEAAEGLAGSARGTAAVAAAAALKARKGRMREAWAAAVRAALQLERRVTATTPSELSMLAVADG